MNAKKYRRFQKIDSVISSICDIPPQSISGVPQLEISGDGFVTVSGCTGIEEYTDELLLIKTKMNKIRIIGEKLNLSTFSEDRLSVSGLIKTVSFE